MAIFVPKDRRSLFRQFLSGMYDAVVITDPNGHIFEINPRTVEYFGYEPDEVVDRPVSVFIPGLKQDVVSRIRKGLEGDRHVVVDANGVSKTGGKIACEVAVSCIDLLNPGDLIFTIRNVERRRAYMNSFRDKANGWEIAAEPLFACSAQGQMRECNESFKKVFATSDDLSQVRYADIFPGEAAQALFRKALAGDKVSCSIAGVGVLTLSPNVHSRRTIGVVGAVQKEV